MAATMSFFDVPPETRYDLRFNLGAIPVRVHPLFWVVTLLLGASGGDLVGLLIWVVIVFVSILIHEFGHVLAMRSYGQPAHVVLHAGGGLAVPDPIGWGGRRAYAALSTAQDILISLAGPVAGFLLAALVILAVVAVGGTVSFTPFLFIIPWPSATVPVGGWLANSIVGTLLWVNYAWGLVNLLPVYPLDGGRIARSALIRIDPLDGGRKSLWLSVIAGGLMAVVGLLLLRSLYMAILFGFLAFQSFQSLGVRWR